MEEIKTLNNNCLKKEREVGLEILRIISIFLILCVHLLNAGLFIQHRASALENSLLRLLYSFFSVSVNVFVLISGYFLVNSKFKWKKILNLWCVVLFYSLTSFAINTIFLDVPFSAKELIKSCLPFLNVKFWFFTAYTLLYLSFPLLNKILHNISKKEAAIIFVAICICSYFSLRFEIADILSIGTGYNIIWFAMLYLIGGILKLYPPTFKRIWYLLGYLGLVLFIWANFFFSNNLPIYNVIHFSAEYTSLPVLLASICLFMTFNGLDIKNKFVRKSILFVSVSTFGIYLFDSSAICNWWRFGVLNISIGYGKVYSVLFVLAFAAITFIVGLIIEKLRCGVCKFIKCGIKKIAKSKQIKE